MHTINARLITLSVMLSSISNSVENYSADVTYARDLENANSNSFPPITKRLVIAVLCVHSDQIEIAKFILNSIFLRYLLLSDMILYNSLLVPLFFYFDSYAFVSNALYKAFLSEFQFLFFTWGYDNFIKSTVEANGRSRIACVSNERRKSLGGTHECTEIGFRSSSHKLRGRAFKRIARGVKCNISRALRGSHSRCLANV